MGWFWFLAGLAVLVAAGAFAFYLVMVKPAAGAARELRQAVAGAIGEIVGQKVEIKSDTVVLSKSAIAEFSTVQRKTQTITKFESSLLGSKNMLILRGDFVVKAGFDLTKPFKVAVDDRTGEVRADFPPAKITSVELRNHEVFFSDNGAWNKLTPENQAQATQQMIIEARLAAEKSDIKEEAERQLATRLHDLLGGEAKKILLRGEEIKL